MLRENRPYLKSFQNKIDACKVDAVSTAVADQNFFSLRNWNITTFSTVW